jgi:hypothetical protein
VSETSGAVKVPAVPEDPWNEGGRTTRERPYVVTAKLSTYLEERGLGGESYRRAACDDVVVRLAAHPRHSQVATTPSLIACRQSMTNSLWNNDFVRVHAHTASLTHRSRSLRKHLTGATDNKRRPIICRCVPVRDLGSRFVRAGFDFIDVEMD